MRWSEDQLADHLKRRGVAGAANTADTSAPPFALPAEIVVDLPFPPSVNRLWRSSNKNGSSQVYLSPSYRKWKDAADRALLATKLSFRAVHGQFAADIDLCPQRGQQRGDIDNRIKAVLDFLQRAGIVVNDKNCGRVTAQWVPASAAPAGCRVTVRAMI